MPFKSKNLSEIVYDNKDKNLPGIVNDNHVDLKKLPIDKLLELQDRETKMTQNKTALNRLKDKGEKIFKFKKEIEDELLRRKESEANLSLAMAGLTLKADVNQMEWTGKLTEKDSEHEEELEEEINPFKILATHSGAGFHKKQIMEEERKTNEPEMEEFALKLCNKMDKIDPKGRFIPSRALKFKPKPINGIKDKIVTISAAEDPIRKFGPAKLVPLEESIALQSVQTNHLKELQLQTATERLKNREFKMVDFLPNKESKMAYREPVHQDIEDEEGNLSDVD